MTQLPGDLQCVIEAQVAEGRAPSVAVLLTNAEFGRVEHGRAEGDGIRSIATLGIADVEAGRFTTISSPMDEQSLEGRLMVRLQTAARHIGQR